MHVLKYLWADAVLSACHLINRIPSSFLHCKNPFSCLYPNKSVYSVALCVFGCTCFVQDLSSVLDKLCPRSIKYVFVGYSRIQKGYRCYNPSARKYFLSTTDVMFLNQFHTSLHKVQLLHQNLFLFHYLFRNLRLLLFMMSLHQCHWKTP